MNANRKGPGRGRLPFRHISEKYPPATFSALFLECLLEQRQVGTGPDWRLLTTPDHFPFIPGSLISPFMFSAAALARASQRHADMVFGQARHLGNFP